MGEADFEGLERRLSETHERIEPKSSDKQRRDSAIADIDAIEMNVTPPLALIKQLDGSMSGALCDQKMQLVWPSGPWKGKPVTAYCVSGDTLVSTSAGVSEIGKTAATVFNVGGHMGATDGVVVQGDRPVVALETTLGYRLVATEDHRISIWNGSEVVLAPISSLSPGDQVVLERGYGLHAGEDAPIDEMELLGFIAGDGYVSDSSVSVLVDVRDTDLIEKVQSKAADLFPRSRIYKTPNRTARIYPASRTDKVINLRIHRRSAVAWAHSWGFASGRKEGGIPDRVKGLAPAPLAAFLRGLWEADGTVSTHGEVKVHTSREKFARDVQQALLSLGVLSHLTVDRHPTEFASKREIWAVSVLAGENRDLWAQRIGFMSKRRRSVLGERAPCGGRSWRKHDDFPIHLYQRYSFYRIARLLDSGQLTRPRSRPTRRPDHAARQRLLREWVKNGYHFGHIKSIEPIGVMPVYDVLNSPSHVFVANGFRVSNCSEPLCITEGECTGPRFVPHMEQYTSTNIGQRQPRKLERDEVIAAVRSFAKRAAAQTNRDEERSNSEILAHVKLVWMKTIQHIKGKGDWRPS